MSANDVEMIIEIHGSLLLIFTGSHIMFNCVCMHRVVKWGESNSKFLMRAVRRLAPVGSSAGSVKKAMSEKRERDPCQGASSWDEPSNTW